MGQFNCVGQLLALGAIAKSDGLHGTSFGLASCQILTNSCLRTDRTNVSTVWKLHKASELIFACRLAQVNTDQKPNLNADLKISDSIGAANEIRLPPESAFATSFGFEALQIDSLTLRSNVEFFFAKSVLDVFQKFQFFLDPPKSVVFFLHVFF